MIILFLIMIIFIFMIILIIFNYDFFLFLYIIFKKKNITIFKNISFMSIYFDLKYIVNSIH